MGQSNIIGQRDEGETGILARVLDRDGKPVTVDIALLDTKSLSDWLDSKDQRYLKSLVLGLLGHDVS